jgi:hypothetical protein
MAWREEHLRIDRLATKLKSVVEVSSLRFFDACGRSWPDRRFGIDRSAYGQFPR